MEKKETVTIETSFKKEERHGKITGGGRGGKERSTSRRNCVVLVH